ncbi:MAG: hypothetical protein RIQ37_920 [Actinomycetota bacterium]
MCCDIGEILKLILQADGASRGNPGDAAYGAVILDENRNLIAEIFAPIGVQTNNYAEYTAVIAGLEYLSNNFSVDQLLIEMDSKLVIEQLAGRWKINSASLRELNQRAQTLLSGIEYELKWIPREQNSLADSAANKALDTNAVTTEIIESSTAQPRSVRAKRQRVEPTTIVLIRHGHTAHTEANLISGSSGEDPELSKLGISEAKQMAEEVPKILDGFGLSQPLVVYHSPQKRARQTAEQLANRAQIRLHTDERLQEIAFGDWEGISMDELSAKFPQEVESWRGSMNIKPPGGESLQELELRVGSFLGEVIAKHPGQTVAVVAHMMPCRVIARRALQAAPQVLWSLQFSPASISVFRFFGDQLSEGFLVNSCAHLRGE